MRVVVSGAFGSNASLRDRLMEPCLMHRKTVRAILKMYMKFHPVVRSMNLVEAEVDRAVAALPDNTAEGNPCIVLDSVKQKRVRGAVAGEGSNIISA